jgi:post-segregation antitoxin (ccd killing protein)
LIVGNPTRGRVEIELDKELVDLAERAGLDLNEVADRALQRALGSEQLKTVPRYAKRFERSQEEIREGVAWYNAHIERDGIFSGAHMPDEEPSDEKARRWEEENAEAIHVSNEELKRNGLWSDRYRLF